MPDDLTGSEIAIVGMACRFPGANDLESYWRNLRDGVESISRLSDADLLAAGVTPAELADPNYVKSAPVLEQIEAFDAGFFGYSAVEAEITDPQQRLLLEVGWEALEHAGYNPETYPRAIGAYVGAKTNTYLFHLASRREVLQSLDFFQIVLGGDLAMLSTRLSYTFDLKGPSYAVQTACSTSLVAVHLACQSLLIDECQMALAGAVAINVPHRVGYLHRAGDILSPDGHCRPFDAEAGGTLFGSGAGVVVLKRLEDALRDGDTVYAVIRGSATNNDGANKATFTAPSVDGQTSVVLEALAAADLDADTISYVEAHGTGTALGDPIEIFALSEAYRASTDRRQFCALGSVKSNLGHLDAAAGMSGLLKTALALRHGQIPPSLHFQRPNPRIDFANSPFFVNTALRPWPKGETPRRAGVSSFGFGGTNAHLILEEAPAQAASGPARPWLLLPLSARSPAALEQATRNLAAHLRAHPEQPLADVAYTLQAGRKAFDERRILVARDRDEALTALETLDPQRVFSAGVRADNRPVAFMFPGQGAQYAGMARDLYEHEAVFRDTVDRCATLLRPLLGLDIRPLIFDEAGTESTKDTKDTNGSGHETAERRTENGEPNGEARGLRLEAWEATTSEGQNSKLKTQNSKLTETRYAQPALFAVEYALAQLWQSWGVKPSALVGHSIGEYVAATLAGVFRLEDALALVASRGRLMQALPAGAMLSVQLPEGELLPLLDSELSLAAVNGPRTCVAAGPEHAVAALEGQLAARDIPYRRLHTSHAFHSAMMDPVVGAFETEVARVQRQAPQLPLVSNRTGTWITAEQAADPRYWAEHLRHAVRFADGLGTLLRETGALLLEVGPGTTLSTFARQIAPDTTALASLRHPNDARPDLAFALTALGRLWLAGAPLEWQALSQGQHRQRVALPTYPFERQRHWIDITPVVADAPAQRANARTGLEDWFYRPAWQPMPLDAGPAATPEGWLLFADDRGLAAGLAERLLAAGHSVTTVRAGGRFRALGPDAYTLDPRQPDDYRRLVAALWQNQPPRRIVHCWGLGAVGGAPLSNAELAAGQQRGFYSLLFLTRALAAQGLDGPLDLDVVASQTQAIGPQDIPEPARAMALGLCRVIPQEYPQITCRSIDLDLHGPDAPDAGQQAELLLAELLARSGERVLAYRAGQRLAQRFERFQPPALEQATGQLRQGGVYLITGGLGNLGLTLASELARRVQARLVLLGRSPLPERASWGGWLETHTADDPTSRRLRAILLIEELGSEVLALSADVTDEAAMADAVALAEARFGALHGVIHAAGSARGSAFRSIRETGVAESLEHFAPKVLGLLVLERVLRGRTLDLVALQSSLSVALGGLGNAAYAAANTFMDAFAVRQQRAGQPWVSIDWDSWHQPGEVAGGIGTTLVDLTIGPDEGAAAFVRLLAAPPGAPPLVSTGDLQTRLDQWVYLKGLQDQGAPASQGGSLPERGELTRRLAAIWQRVLDLPRVDLDANFFDLGGNSLSGMQLISELKRELHVQLAPVALFEAPSIRALADLLSPKETETLPPATPAPVPVPASAGGPVAIVGMAGRFPGAESVEQFWQNLRDGVESIRFFGDEELGAAGIPPALLRDPRYVKARPVLGAVDGFDAAFFGYTPREAALMDPQHRLFMEVSWEALEQAGYAGPDYAGTVGIFGGASISTYLLNLYANPAFVASIDPLQTIIGNDKDSLTTSVSYKLNLKGPSLAVQTFCSTSLVAVHLASQSLQRGECSVALAGGVSVVVPQQSGYHYQEEGIVSPDGHCRPFDARAAGTLFGNGAGVVVLRRLEDALADGDTIYAVVKGSAINNDGSLKAGYTAPSVDGQAEVITAALAAAQVPPDAIGYVEAHGTGTALGDPIEVAALSKAFRASTDRRQFCALGSVKSNVGHLDRAAGVAALIKAALALRHGLIPPSLHYETPNPRIDFAGSPFFVNTALRPWPKGETPRRAGVSALGFGGTNAHLVLEEAPEPAEPAPARPWQLLTLSAKTPAALEQATRNLAEHLRAYPDANLADVAYTLQIGRRAFDQRRVVVARDRDEALALLEANDLRRILSASQNTLDRRIAFMFPGQGAQYTGMARDLYGHEAVFRDTIDHCADLLRPLLGLDIRPLIFGEAGTESTKDTKDTNGAGHRTAERRTENREPDGEARDLSLEAWEPSGNAKRNTQNAKLAETRYAQPALFVVEYALAQLWQSWGVTPSALIGHSIGEYVAATLAGVFRLEDALALVATRGRLMQTLPAGAMLSVQLPEGELLPLLREGLSLAAVNGPRACVAAGPEHAVVALEGQLAARDIPCRRLHTSHAFHSAMMDPLVETFAAEVARVQRQAPQLPLVSNRTGTWITAEQAADPRYWAEHLRHAVRFADGLATLLADPDTVLLEVGPGRTLSALAKQARDPQDSRPIIASLRHPQDSTPDPASMLSALGQLWLAGQTIDWRRLHSGVRRRVPLPTYPFERQRFWLDSQAALPGTALPAAARQGDPVRKQADLANWFSLPVWQRAAAPRPPRPDALAAQPRRWLIFADQTGLARALAQRLEQADHQVVTAVPGADFAQIDNRLYALDPRQPEHYQTLLEQLDGPPEQIVHLWGVHAGAVAGDAAGFEAEQERGFYSLLFLVQALGRMDSPPARIALVTSHAHSITPDEPLHPARASLHGLGRVIPQELPQFSCRSIDVGLPHSNQALQRLGDLLLAELLAEGEELGVVYRGQQRWVQRFEPLPLEEEPPSAPALRPGGVYLLTGGLAEIGLALSGYLARSLHARLILVESSDFPPRDAWEEWLERRPAGDATSRKIRHIAELERQGAEVLVLGGDPADPAQLRAAIAEARARFGVLHGVIHAAAVTGERAFRGIQETDRAECGWHFVPKAHGLYALEQALGDEPIDFCALVSSLAAFLGGRGYAAYAAANLFMDAFAHVHNRNGGAPWVSINWDAWQLEDGKMTAMSQDLALLAMTPDEGGAALRRILAAGGLDQVVVSTADLPARIAQWQERLRAMRGVASGEPAGPPATLHPRPNLPTPFVPPENDLERTIATVWQQALGFEQVGINDNFFDLGADSLIAIRVVAQLKQALGAELSVVSLYETLTIKALAESLAQNGQTDQLGDRESREAKISRRKHYRQQKRSER